MLILTSVLLVVSTMSVHAAYNVQQQKIYTMNTNAEVSEKFLENEEKASEAYNNLFDSFQKEKSASKTYDLNVRLGYSVEGMHANDFPDYYAGTYVNTYGDLVVMLTNGYDTKEIRNRIAGFAKTDDIFYQEVKYSYADLINLMSEIEEYCGSEEYETQAYYIVGYGIFDNKNKVIIYLNSIEESVINNLKEIFGDTDAISYELCETRIEDSASTFNCGAQLTSNSKTFSAGYRAKYTNSSGTVVNGLVTCGHAFSGVTSNIAVKQGSTSIGNVSASKKQYSGKVDAAFISVSSGITMNNTVLGGSVSLSTSVTMNAAAGSTVYMRGYQHLRSGTVTSTSYTSHNNETGVTLSDMVKTSYSAVNGDSGGVVYNTNSSGYSYVVGIHSRSATDGSFSVYCKASNINSALGISIR